MGRGKAVKDLDLSKLQSEIDATEKTQTFDNLSAMFAALSERPWAKTNGYTAALLRLRYTQHSLKSKTKPKFLKGVKTDKPAAITVLPLPQVTDEISSEIFRPFTDRGITVNSLADIVTSVYKDDETNKLIQQAWHEVRKTAGPSIFKGTTNE